MSGHEDCIEVYKKYAPDKLCDKLVFILDKYSTSGKSSPFTSLAETPDRQDFQLSLDWVGHEGEDEQVNSVLNNALDEYIKKYVGLIGYFKLISFRIKLQKTLIGNGFHTWHCETGRGEETSRALVWTIFLNDIPDGEGELEFLHYGKRIQPRKGDVLIFPAFFMHTHRGNPPITTNKYIATGWWHYA